MNRSSKQNKTLFQMPSLRKCTTQILGEMGLEGEVWYTTGLSPRQKMITKSPINLDSDRGSIQRARQDLEPMIIQRLGVSHLIFKEVGQINFDSPK